MEGMGSVAAFGTVQPGQILYVGARRRLPPIQGTIGVYIENKPSAVYLNSIDDA